MFRWTLYDDDLGISQVLKKDPKGYESLTLTHKRDEKWHGVHYDFTNDFGFFCKGGGKELVDAAYDNKSQEANVRIKLEVKCNGTWTTILNGKLNFSTYRQEYKSKTLYTYLNAENIDITQKIKNREDMEVDLLQSTSLDGVPLNNYTYLNYDLNLHSKVIRLESQWLPIFHGCCFYGGAGGVMSFGGIKAFYSIPHADLILGDFKESVPLESRCSFPSSFDNFLDDATPIINTTNNPVFTAPNTVRIRWKFRGVMSLNYYNPNDVPSDCTDTCASSGVTGDTILLDEIHFQLRLYFGSEGDLVEANNCGANPLNQDGIKYINLVSEGPDASNGNPSLHTFHNINYPAEDSIDIILNPGDKMWFYWVMDFNLHTTGHDIKVEFDYGGDAFASENYLNILSDTISDATTCKSIAIHEAWSRLSEIITDQPLAFKSEFFGRTNSLPVSYTSDGCGSKVAITSGKNIREIEAPIKPSLKTMFDFCNSIWGIGLGIEKLNGVDIIRAEELEYFYSQTEVLKMDFVPNIQMKHTEQRVFNEISLGFSKWQTQNINGLDEPLTKIKYVIPEIKNNKQKFEQLSPFICAMYAIELTRRTKENTKDTSYDEDIFAICLNQSDLTIAEKDELMSSISGLISPETAYNLRFLLTATFDRLKNQFVSGLTKLATLADPILMPAQAEGNSDVTYSYVVDGCAGDGFGTLQNNGRAGRYPHIAARRDNPIWLPEEYTFDYPLSFEKYLDLVDNPYGLIRFSDTNIKHKSGWLLNLDYNVRNKTGSFTILRNAGGNEDLSFTLAGDYDGRDYDYNNYYTG